LSTEEWSAISPENSASKTSSQITSKGMKTAYRENKVRYLKERDLGMDAHSFHKDLIPTGFKCPLGGHVMRDPWVASDGFSYEVSERCVHVCVYMYMYMYETCDEGPVGCE
jgi:hypothetical protein